MAKIKVGDRFESNNCGWSEVISYETYANITIKFDKTGYVTNAQGHHIRKGTVKDKLSPTIFGVGFMGEGEHNSTVDGKNAKAYVCWKGMLKRCYSDKERERYPTYKDCSVYHEWHNFQNFAEYYETKYKEGYHLDKDLLFKGNKVYSPETCVFVPPNLNGFTTGGGNARGKYKIGVHLNVGSKTNPYTSQINNNTGQQIYLGLFPTEQLAYEAWLEAKLQKALEYKPEMDEIDLRIYPNVVEIIKEM